MLNNTFSEVDEISFNNSQLLNDPFIYGFNIEQDEFPPLNSYFSKYDFNTYLMNTQEKSKEIENIDKQSEGKVFIEITLTKISEVNPKRPRPPHYTFLKIKNEIFPKLNLDKDIKEAFQFDDNVRKIEEEASDANFEVTIRRRAKRGTIKKEQKEKKELGRKRKSDTNDRPHDKNCKDNMLQKFKTNIHNCLLQDINAFLMIFLDKDVIISLIEKTKIKKQKEKDFEIIKPLDYCIFVNQTSKRENVKFLDMPLKQFLSQDISCKYSTYLKEANKIIIDEIMNNHNNEAINFIFNLKLSDWLDVFLKKKEFSDFEEFNSNILVSMNVRVDELLKKIYDKERDKNFFSRFILYMYNFERILCIKNERKTKKKDKKDGNE
jgi:hypothetical protein